MDMPKYIPRCTQPAIAVVDPEGTVERIDLDAEYCLADFARLGGCGLQNVRFWLYAHNHQGHKKDDEQQREEWEAFKRAHPGPVGKPRKDTKLYYNGDILAAFIHRKD